MGSNLVYLLLQVRDNIRSITKATIPTITHKNNDRVRQERKIVRKSYIEIMETEVYADGEEKRKQKWG